MNQFELGTQYRDAKAATVRERKRWADAEVRYASTGDDGDRVEIVAAYEAVQFSMCCEVAAGEMFKGESFAQVVARHERRPVRPEEVGRR